MAGRPRAIDRAIKAQEAEETRERGSRSTAEVRAEVRAEFKAAAGPPRRLPATVVRATKTEVWRQVMRRMAGGDNAEEVIQSIVDIAAGKAWIPKLPDGREGPPQLPTAGDRLAAAVHITNMLFGKPVAQTEIIAAEKQTYDQARVKALTDAELKALIYKQVLAEGNVEDAEFEPATPPEVQEVRESEEEDDE